MLLLNVVAALLLGTSHAGFSLARNGPPPADPGNCFAGKLPFFQNFARTTGTSFDRMGQLQNACRELSHDEWNEPTTVGERVFGVVGGMSRGLNGAIAGSFSNWNGSPEQRRYKAQLDRIKTNPNPMARIQAVYELAARTQGYYDEESYGLHNAGAGLIYRGQAPGNLIDSAKRDGTVGVCREMASLLQWSLQEVARWSGSKSMALGPNDFSSSVVLSSAPTGDGGWGGHAWVRINMPIHNSAGALVDFRHFDLDTTWYPERFSPLFPRRAGASRENIATLRRQCGEVRNCLAQKGFFESSSPTSRSNPATRTGSPNSSRSTR